MRRFPEIVSLASAALAAVAVCAADAQPPVARPQPPPPAPNAKAPAKPGTATVPAPAAAQPLSPPPAAAPATKTSGAGADGPPWACQHGAPVIAGAQYLEAYDAGMGQTFCLYGSAQAFIDVVTYYRTVLKDRGELVFDAPATHMFEVGRFKEAEVAFPPGVTVKDYSFGGSPGYMNPRPGSAPAFFPTIIQIVPPPPPQAGRRD